METEKNTWKNPNFLASLPPWPPIPPFFLELCLAPSPIKNFVCSLVPHTLVSAQILKCRVLPCLVPSLLSVPLSVGQHGDS